jgi:hypothetical protein
MNSKEENSEDFVPIASKNSASAYYLTYNVLTTKKNKVLLSLELLIFSLAKQTYMARAWGVGEGGDSYYIHVIYS